MNSSQLATVKVNGILVWSQQMSSISTTASVMYIGRSYVAAQQYCNGIIHFVEIRNTIRTAAQIGAIANKLCLSCQYTDSSDNTRTIIDDMCPTDSLLLGFAQAGSSAITSYDSSSYKYGRREGLTGGNRKVFLGWKYFSGGTVLTWDNPFGTRKVKSIFTWAQDANGRNETETSGSYYSGTTSYGEYNVVSIVNKISISIQSGGIFSVCGSWQTSGYIGCYAEILEDE